MNRFIISYCLGLVVVWAGPISAQAAPKTYSYVITHPTYGAIGTYDRVSDEADGEIRATAHLRITVKILGFIVHRETATQDEVWQGPRLVSFQSSTLVNGKPLNVHGQVQGAAFVVTTPTGARLAPANVTASDPWSLNRLGPGTVVSIKSGRLDPVIVTGGEAETVVIGGIPTSTRHFHVNTAAQPNKWEAWIDARGVPVKFRSLESDGPIDFTLVSTSS